MARAGDHQVIIRRWGRSHTASCPCGWSGHAWNDLRPAEADAWEHLYGEECIVDTAAIPGPGEETLGASRTLYLGALSETPPDAPGTPDAPDRPGPGRAGTAPAELARRARELAGSPSPYGRQGPTELWNLAGGDHSAVHAAVSEISGLLAAHSRRSAGTADGEWLELITAKRLLEESLRESGVRSYST